MRPGMGIMGITEDGDHVSIGEAQSCWGRRGIRGILIPTVIMPPLRRTFSRRRCT
jgi:hypothetical protein